MEDRGTPNSLTDNYATHSYQWSTNPADNEAGEWDDIDALQIGVEIYYDGATGKSPQIYCTQVYVEVDYNY